MDPAQLLHEYGPAYFPYVVLVCALLENDVSFVMAGIYAASVTPQLNPCVAIGAGIAGALCHDSFWFFLARNRAAWIKEKRAWKRIGPQVEQWASRFGVIELFLSRFIPGTRVPSVFFWGLQRLRIPIFYGVDLAALLIWGSALTFVGYKFGERAETMLGQIKQQHLGTYLLITLVLSLVIYFSVRAFTRYEIVKHGTPPDDPRAD
jgi:membrane protein DedA with SNARE-associated domain